MDFLKKGQDMLNKSSGSKPAEGQPAAGQPAAGQPATGQPAGEQMDYGDKAADFLGKKSGHQMDRNTTEKVTDGARGLFEKVTGKKVDPKYSN